MDQPEQEHSTHIKDLLDGQCSECLVACGFLQSRSSGREGCGHLNAHSGIASQTVEVRDGQASTFGAGEVP